MKHIENQNESKTLEQSLTKTNDLKNTPDKKRFKKKKKKRDTINDVLRPKLQLLPPKEFTELFIVRLCLFHLPNKHLYFLPLQLKDHRFPPNNEEKTKTKNSKIESHTNPHSPPFHTFPPPPPPTHTQSTSPYIPTPT